MTRAWDAQLYYSSKMNSWPASLTFWHRTGISPYTSPYGFAGTCVFGKQSPGILSLRPPKFLLTQKFWRQSLLRTYARFFAEFLNEESPVPLRLLASSTCFGLWYGSNFFKLRSFSWKALHSNQQSKTLFFLDRRILPLKASSRIYQTGNSWYQEHQTTKTLELFSFVTPSQKIGGPEY